MDIQTTLNQLCLIAWKSVKMRRRYWFLTCIEISVPISLFILMTLVRLELPHHPSYLHNQTTYYDQRRLPAQLDENLYIFFTPTGSFENTLMDNLTKILNIPHSRIIGFNTKSPLYENYNKYAWVHNTTVMIIEFENDINKRDGNDIPYKLNYNIRSLNFTWETGYHFEIHTWTGPIDRVGDNNSYYRSGFLSVQCALDLAFIQLVTEIPIRDVVKIYIQQFPYPPYKKVNDYNKISKKLLPTITLNAFNLLAPMIISRIIHEKISGIKELAKIMGLRPEFFWVGWIIHEMVTVIPDISIIVIILTISFGPLEPLLLHANPILLWIFFLLYLNACICFCFSLSLWFRKPTIAIMVNEVIRLVTYFITERMLISPKKSWMLRFLLCIFPNMTMVSGYMTITTLDARDIGLQTSNFFKKPSTNPNELSMAVIFILFVVQIVLHTAIAWYWDFIPPASHVSDFKFSFRNHRKVEASTSSHQQPNCETPSTKMIPGIQIVKLRKQFGTNITINELTIDIYKGYITVLLGHNGAGKTTVMSIIAGSCPFTSGSVYVNGLNIRTHLNQIRQFLGLCLQSNHFYPNLNVMEHFCFFSKLTGTCTEEAKQQAIELVKSLDLITKSESLAKTLSYCSKRKLALGIALAGNVDVLMLDEPTSGMDAKARRNVWNLLTKMRGKRTIIITTHSMEEADVLGDRIAIMDHGNLQCYGSSLYLKGIYGAGYHLSLMKNLEADENQIFQAILRYVPTALSERKFGALLTYTLPTDARSKFSELFKYLEENKNELLIDAFAVSVTTLETVFLRVGQQARMAKSKSFRGETLEDEKAKIEIIIPMTKGHGLQVTRFRVLFKKKFVYAYRNPWVYALQALTPITILILTIIFGEVPIIFECGPALPLHLDFYGNTEIVYSSTHQTALGIADNYAIYHTNHLRNFVPSVTEEVVEIGLSNMVRYMDDLIVGAEFNNSIGLRIHVNALYSGYALHSAPISLNMVTNALLRYMNSGFQYSIAATNKPLQGRSEIDIALNEVFTVSRILSLWLIVWQLGMLFLIGLFVHFPMTERISGMKHLQLMTGTPAFIYWISCYIFDLLLYLIVIVLMLFIVLIMDFGGSFGHPHELGVLFLLLFMYGLSGILYSYVISFFGQTISGTFTVILATTTLFAMVSTTVLILMEYVTTFINKTNLSFWIAIFSVIPHSSLSYAIVKFAIMMISRRKCNRLSPNFLKRLCHNTDETNLCCKNDAVRHKWAYLHVEDGIGVAVQMLGVDVIIYGILIALIESNIICYWLQQIKEKTKYYFPCNRTDENIIFEHERLTDFFRSNAALNQSRDILLVHDLVKVYGRKLQAVGGLSFGVPIGQCFGLLGVSATGKTTIFQIITGQIVPTKGETAVISFKLSCNNRKKYLSLIGYCPQKNNLNESLTAKEHITLFAILRGISPVLLPRRVNYWLRKLGLIEFADRVARTYSNGNKRQLSTALALVGSPPLVLLDEPTTGVDTFSRRNLWNLLTTIKHKGQTIVLTSHSITECEALCGRIGILTNGQFSCLGTIPYLKKRYGRGYMLTLKIKIDELNENIAKLKKSVNRAFQLIDLIEEHESYLQYQITDPSITWSKLFQISERIYQGGLLEDYTISETSLEQLFFKN